MREETFFKLVLSIIKSQSTYKSHEKDHCAVANHDYVKAVHIVVSLGLLHAGSGDFLDEVESL